MIRYFRLRLVAKLFISYLIVILVGVVVLSTAAELVVPRAFNRHLAAMNAVIEDSSVSLDMDLFDNFHTAVNESLMMGTLAAFLVAVLASLFISRQVVNPIRAMQTASQRIAEGHYDERVNVAGDLSRGELDELAQLAISFNQMANKLEQTELLRRQLIGDVAHELRTPLTTIKGYMEGLIEGVLPSNEETFHQLWREVDRLQRLVNDLQELSQVEAGAYKLKLKPVGLIDLISAVARRLDPQFEEKGVSLDMDFPPKLAMVRVDEDRINQVLVNLMGNALQYTPSGGKVSVKVQQRDEEVQVTVSDTGIGIPGEHLPHIFARFYRVDKSRVRPGGGSGIGLTIAKHLVEAHRGRIWAESRGAGKGSTFVFTLPVGNK